MIQKILLLILSLTFFNAHAKEVGDVNVADNLTVDQHKLVLNGAGVRSKFWVDVYVGALYLPKKMSDAEAIIAADQPMSIQLHITSGLVNGKKMADATRDGFLKSTGGDLGDIEPQVNTLIDAFKDSVEKGDVFELSYVPNVGVKIIRNGEFKTTAKGLKFKQAMFGIWLSDDPVQGSLKKGMLGQ